MLYTWIFYAFDQVLRSLLLKKRAASGTSMVHFCNGLTAIFLKHHRVVLEGKISDWLPVTSRVPQGSILGPLLFIIYANDMPDSLSERSYWRDCVL